MSFGTRIDYGGLALRNVQIRNFDQLVQQDESQSDAISSRFTISVESIVHEQDAQEIGFRYGAQNAIDSLSALQIHFQHDRQPFAMSFEGVEWLSVSHAVSDGTAGNQAALAARLFRGAVDVKNGPKVSGVSVVHVAGYKAFRVAATFEINVILCNSWKPSDKTIVEPGKPDRYLLQHFLVHNRWSLEESIGEDFHWTRSIRGKCRIAHPSLWSASVRYLITPRLSPKFRFAGASYVHSKDGLTLDYSHSSRQEHSAPPAPASEWHATQSEQVGEGGGKGLSQVNISLKGPPGVKKKDLLTAALAVVSARYGFQLVLTPEKTLQWYVIQANITDVLNENEIHVSLTVHRTYSDPGDIASRQSWFGLSWDMLERWPVYPGGKKPKDLPEFLANYNPKKWPEPIPWADTGPASLFQDMFQSPCGSTPAASIAPIFTAPESKQEPPEYRRIIDDPKPKLYRDNYGGGITAEPPYTESKVNEAMKEGIYIEAKMENRYMTDHGRVQVPYFPEIPDRVSTDPNAPPPPPSKKPTCLITRIYQPVTRRAIWYRATRVGKNPVIPQIHDYFKDENEINCFLDEEEVLPSPPSLLPDGQNFKYEVEIRLVYLMSRNIQQGEKFQTGTLPTDTLKKAVTFLPKDSNTQSTELT